MSILNAAEQRRTYYNINKDLPVKAEEVVEVIQRATVLVPDAFNMKSARVVVALGDAQDRLWDAIYNSFGGKVSREKIDSFKSGAGTVLYFIDNSVVENMQNQFSSYAANFPIWANQANGMLQFTIWNALRELNIGASLQHYNPVIDENVKALFDIPSHYQLIAQMPFGGIVSEPSPKPEEELTNRVRIVY